MLDSGESPYIDEDGQSICPLMLQAAYIDRDGVHYGVVRDMLDTQDEINKRRSKLLHQLNTRQTMGLKGRSGRSPASRPNWPSQMGMWRLTPNWRLARANWA